MSEPVSYSEPGTSLPRENLDSVSGFAPANPFVRLFARVINGTLLFLLSCVFWLATFIAVGVIMIGDEVRYLWSLLRDLPVIEASDADRVIEGALWEYLKTYTVGEATLDSATIVLIALGATLLVLVLHLLYLTLMARFAGGDFAHLVMGLRVVDYGSGQRPSFDQAFGRALLKQLDWLIFPWLINGVMALAAPQRRHLYDLIANTMVVSRKSIPSQSDQPQPTTAPGAPQLPGNRAIPLPPSQN